MSDKKDINQKEWAELTQKWAVMYPPERPSRGEIKIYENHLKNVLEKNSKKIKALLMGATPELRDLLAKHNIDVTLVDINPNSVKAMNNLLEISSQREKIIIASWLDMPLMKDQYDLVLSDHGLQNILFETWEKFLAEISRVLKKDGHLITNVVTIEKEEFVSVEEMITDMKNNIFTREDKFRYMYHALFGLSDAGDKKYSKRLDDLNDELLKHLKNKKISQKEYKFLEMPWKGFHTTFAPKNEVDKSIGKYFKIKSILVNFEHPVFTCHKIYFCKNNK